LIFKNQRRVKVKQSALSLLDTHQKVSLYKRTKI